MKSGNYSYQPLGLLIQQLKQLCEEKQSGMLFIITDDKHASHILLMDGNITEISLGYEKGEKALALLCKVIRCRFQFSQDKHNKTVKAKDLTNANGGILEKLSTNYKAQKNRYILNTLESAYALG